MFFALIDIITYTDTSIDGGNNIFPVGGNTDTPNDGNIPIGFLF